MKCPHCDQDSGVPSIGSFEWVMVIVAVIVSVVLWAIFG